MKRYTPYEKKRILRHARIHGVTAASVRFGAGKSSIHLWQKRERDESPPTPVVTEKRIKRSEKSDPIKRPSHYCVNGVECWDVIEAWELGYNLGNVLKYVCRHGRKHSNAVEDLRKAQAYLTREIKRREVQCG